MLRKKRRSCKFQCIYYLKFISPKKFVEVADFFFVDTNPFVLKYWNEPKDSTYDWRGVAPRETYIANVLKVLLYTCHMQLALAISDQLTQNYSCLN